MIQLAGKLWFAVTVRKKWLKKRKTRRNLFDQKITFCGWYKQSFSIMPVIQWVFFVVYLMWALWTIGLCFCTSFQCIITVLPATDFSPCHFIACCPNYTSNCEETFSLDFLLNLKKMNMTVVSVTSPYVPLWKLFMTGTGIPVSYTCICAMYNKW